MSVAVIADAHLGGLGGPATPLVRQLEEIPDEGCSQLVLLGDLFHAWVGASRYETLEIKETTEALAELRRVGLRIDYVEGNRDFFIGDGPYASLFSSVGSEVIFEASGQRHLAVHGDGLDDRDYLYRFWRRLSKSAPSRFGMLHLPRAVARALVGVTERQLAKTNFKHKSDIPQAVIQTYAERRLQEGFDVLLLGHFHEAHQWRSESGEVRLLEAWFRSRRVEWFGRAAG